MIQNRWLLPGLLFVVGSTLAACGGGPSGYSPPAPATPVPVNSTTPSPAATPTTTSSAPVATPTGAATPTATPAVPAPTPSGRIIPPPTATPTVNPLATPTATPPPATPTPAPTPVSTSTPVVPAGVKIYLVNHTKTGSTGQTPSVTVFSATASGNVAPVAQISGSASQLDYPQYIGLDGSGHMWVTNQGSTLGGTINEYAAGASGNVAPIAQITGLSSPEGIAVDATGDVYVALVDRLNEYAPGTTGANPAAMRSIGAPPNAKTNSSGLAGPYGMKLDAKGNLFVAQEEAIYVFGPTQTGNVAPMQNISGMQALLAADLDVVTDSAGNIYCINYNLNNINEYPAGTTGATMPSNVITSPNITQPTGLAIDKNDNLYVADYANNSIVIIPAGTTGAAVGTVISGALTNIQSPYGIAVQ